jgi:hypothetical protein
VKNNKIYSIYYYFWHLPHAVRLEYTLILIKLDFTPYKTYAFHKNGIDKVEISDGQEKILNAIDRELSAKE